MKISSFLIKIRSSHLSLSYFSFNAVAAASTFDRDYLNSSICHSQELALSSLRPAILSASGHTKNQYPRIIGTTILSLSHHESTPTHISRGKKTFHPIFALELHRSSTNAAACPSTVPLVHVFTPNIDRLVPSNLTYIPLRHRRPGEFPAQEEKQRDYLPQIGGGTAALH